MADEDELEAPVLLDVYAVGEFEAPVYYVNHIEGRMSAQEFVLTFSQILPSYALTGESGEIIGIRAKVLANIVMSPEKVAEVHKELGELLAQRQSYVNRNQLEESDSGAAPSKAE